MRKQIGLMLAVLTYTGFFLVSFLQSRTTPDELLMQDVSRLLSAEVYDVQAHTTTEGLQEALKFAEDNNLKVSIAGSHHSQGGHIFYDGALILDMTEFDEIISLDQENKILRVESGATWEEIQEYLQPYGLALKVMQSSYIFTVGGSMSANIHGRDIEKTLMVDAIKSFRLLLASGEIVNVSRTENAELFQLVMGGYGLFGVILDVDIEVTEDEILERKSMILDYKDFPTYFLENIKDNQEIVFHMSRPSVVPENLLEEIIVETWSTTDHYEEELFTLLDEEHVFRDKFFFGLSRYFDWGKELRWALQKKTSIGTEENQYVSRNNAMRPPTAPLEFLDHQSSLDTDIVQEYFIPIRNFVSWVDDLRIILEEEDANVLSFTIRYVKQNQDTLLSYTPNEDAFSIIVFMNQPLSNEGIEKYQHITERIVDISIASEGTYYLTYQLYPTEEQIHAAYPNLDAFFQAKLKYDPNERFMNKFYEKYALGQEVNFFK